MQKWSKLALLRGTVMEKQCCWERWWGVREREWKKKRWGIVVQRGPGTTDDQLTQFTAPLPAASSRSGYSDIPVSALLVWVSVLVSTWRSFCFKENLGKSSGKTVIKEHSSSYQVERSQPFVWALPSEQERLCWSSAVCFLQFSSSLKA